MRFFTMSWWCGVQEGRPDNPSTDYWAHLDAVRSRVSPDQRPALEALLALALHDTNLCQLRLDPSAATLQISLENRYAGGKHITLAYSGVEQFASESNRIGFSGLGYGDLGYDEVDLSPTGALVHRMLFSSGIEFTVVFRRFELLLGDPAAPGTSGTAETR